MLREFRCSKLKKKKKKVQHLGILMTVCMSVFVFADSLEVNRGKKRLFFKWNTFYITQPSMTKGLRLITWPWCYQGPVCWHGSIKIALQLHSATLFFLNLILKKSVKFLQEDVCRRPRVVNGGFFYNNHRRHLLLWNMCGCRSARRRLCNCHTWQSAQPWAGPCLCVACLTANRWVCKHTRELAPKNRTG